MLVLQSILMYLKLSGFHPISEQSWYLILIPFELMSALWLTTIVLSLGVALIKK